MAEMGFLNFSSHFTPRKKTHAELFKRLASETRLKKEKPAAETREPPGSNWNQW